MVEIKRILVATDLSPRADRALDRAVQLAAAQAAKLTVLYVQEELLLKKWTEQSLREVRKKLRQKSKAWYQQNNLTATIRTIVGKPFVEIIRRARTEKADVVLVGAHGEHFLRDLFLGTTAEAVIRKGDRTVLVVKQPPHGLYQRVLVPVDFSDASRQALEAAFALAPVAEFHVFHATGAVFEEQLRLGGLSESDIIRHRRRAVVDARQDMERFLRGVDCGTRHVRSQVQSGRAVPGISQAVAQLGADLVALGTRGRSDLPYTLLGSVAQLLLREMPCDVLLARPAHFHFELP
jgi:nucleotide-binding universal stress UspA family protein